MSSVCLQLKTFDESLSFVVDGLSMLISGLIFLNL